MSRWSAMLPEPGAMRVLVVGSLVNTVGSGLFLATAMIYYVRVVGVSATAAGAALSVAALAALLAAAPLGHFADRVGPREAVIADTAVSGGLMLLLATVRDFWLLTAVLVCWSLAQSLGHSARGAVIAAALPPEQRSRGRAYLRAVVNAGIMGGVLLGGVAISIDTPQAYRWMIIGNGISFLLATLVYLRLPKVAALPRDDDGPALVALRDRPYLAVAALNGVLSVHYGVLEIAVPLWVLEHTEAPRWMIAVMLALNCAGIVLFQVRASRGTDDTAGASRAMAVSGFVIAGACVLYALAAGRSTWVAVAVLLAATLVHVVGELRQAAGAFGISYSLAPEGRHGQYQGTFGMGFQVSQMVSPLLVTTLALAWGTTGWLLLAGMFVATGFAVPLVTRWAEGTRTAEAVPVEA